jgi:ATP-dependent Clp protease ATP-binding subunit ClpA
VWSIGRIQKATVFVLWLPLQVGLMADQEIANRALQLERFSYESRAALFEARSAVSRYGGDHIETAHLLFGLLQGTPLRVSPFIKADWSLDKILERLRPTLPHGDFLPESLDIPLSRDLQRTLARASREADRLASQTVRPEHLLLAVLDEPSNNEALLREAGVTREAIETFLQNER